MKKCISVFVAFILVLSLSACDTSFITENIKKLGKLTDSISFTYETVETSSSARDLEQTEVSEDLHYIFCYPELTKRQQQLYRIFLTASEEMPDNFINLGYSTDSDTRDISLAYRALLYDHPEIFWMPHTYIIGYKKSGKNTNLLIAFEFNDNQHDCSYMVSKPQRNAKRDSMNKLINVIVGYSKDYSTVYEKVRFLNDFICDNTEYDKNHAFAHTSYGCIISGKAVCEGYSKAFQLLCSACGIKCEVICGISEKEDHMWNCVNIDGKWSYTDVTWNDVGEKELQYAYFNISEKQLLFDHKFAPLIKDASKDTIENGSIVNFTKHKCDDTSNTFYAKSDTVINSNYKNAARAISDKALFKEKYTAMMFLDDAVQKEFETNKDEAISVIQKNLNNVEIKSYSTVRDIIVFYWN